MATEAERREARRQRILARGTDRLASITGEKAAAKPEAGATALQNTPPKVPEEASESVSARPSVAAGTLPEGNHGIENVARTVKADSGDSVLGSERLGSGAAQQQQEFAQLASFVSSFSSQIGEGAPRGGPSGSGDTETREARKLAELTGRCCSALEAAVTATQTARVCSSVVLAFVLIFAHYVHACSDSTLLGAAPFRQPSLLLASMNGTIVLGWCILSGFGGQKSNVSGNPFAGMSGAEGLLRWLGHMDLAARMLSLVSKITQGVTRDVSFFIVTFTLVWVLRQYILPSFCLLRASFPA